MLKGDHHTMVTRREAIGLLGSMSATLFAAARSGPSSLLSLDSGITRYQGDPTPRLAPGTPFSPQRMALIDAFKKESEAVVSKFEARTNRSDWVMPYRLFRPDASGPLPLVLYLHGSGGMGDDNLRQIGLGNIFGARVWALPGNQKKFPCYIVAPQTDRGWVRYGAPPPGDSMATIVPGLGDGARLALEIVDALCGEFPIDRRRIYVTGQSMGGGGVWHMTSQRKDFFAAAVPCCGSSTEDVAVDSAGTPLWNFHGDADHVVPVTVSGDRIAALVIAGKHPLHTEYHGVGHNVWEWAYTEPELVRWVFSKRRDV